MDKPNDIIDALVLKVIKDGGWSEARLIEAALTDKQEFKDAWDKLPLDPWKCKRPAFRVIDKSLQRLRKKGKIAYRPHDRKWEV